MCVYVCPMDAVFRISFLCVVSCAARCQAVAAHTYTNTWAVRVSGGDDEADRIAHVAGFWNLGRIHADHDSLYHFQHGKVRKHSSVVSRRHHGELLRRANVTWARQQKVHGRSNRAVDVTGFNDVGWRYQWYLNRGAGLDMNVQAAWAQGYTGAGVVVTVMDDGLDYTHPDLVGNYDSLAAHDTNDGDGDPRPRLSGQKRFHHGTRCAGIVAAAANNTVCAVGVAYNAKIGGVRMLDGIITDAVEATSVAHNSQHIDIYLGSWGPFDNGLTVEGPGTLTRRMFRLGASNGRQGRGNIFVWASGNGGQYGDTCSCDGYSNTMYTVTVSSANENGAVPWYAEPCAAILAATYSTDAVIGRPVITTDLFHRCTISHSGTSVSAPLAAGIIALALQANSRLTWRDVQHLIVRTSRTSNLIADDWVTTGTGRRVSHYLGFGLLDAGAMVRLATRWVPVPPQHRCEIVSANSNVVLPAFGQISLPLQSDGCRADFGKRVSVVEHVYVKISITAENRGALHLYLTSPAGTRSTMLFKRRLDVSDKGFRNWFFMTTHSWGETAVGTWTLTAANDGASDASILAWSLVLYGTERSHNNGR